MSKALADMDEKFIRQSTQETSLSSSLFNSDMRLLIAHVFNCTK